MEFLKTGWGAEKRIHKGPCGADLLAACRLYGFADRELVTEFYKIMCPEQNAAERVGTFWKQRCSAHSSIISKR